MSGLYLLRRGSVEQLTGMSKSAIYRAMSENDFPRPVKIGKRAVAWRSTDVTAWLNSRSVA